MLKRMVMPMLFCLLATPFGMPSYAQSSPPKVDPEARPVQNAKSSNPQGDEAGGIEVAEKHRLAIGASGDEGRIETVELHSEVEVLGRINKVTRLTDRATKRFYSLTEGPNGNNEMGFDGKRVWQKTPFFHGYLADDDPVAMRIIKGENESPLLNYKTTGQKLYRLPNETIDGKEYLVVTTTTLDPRDQEVQVRLYLDPATYFIRRVVRGAAITQTSTLDDYRKVDNGGWMAFTQTTTNPNATVVSRIISIKHNVSIDPAKFEYHDDSAKPASPKPEPTSEGGNATPPSGDAAGESIPEAKRVEAFEMAWSKINDTYWDRTFNGVDWKATHEKYLPLVKATAGNKEFHQLLHRMAGELHLSHFRVLPPDNVVGLNTRTEDRKNGGIGAEFHWLDGQLIVVDLDKDYPAYAAGIRKGFAVTRIDGKTPDEIYRESKKDAGYEPREALARVRGAQQELGGRIDVPVKLEVLNEQDKRIQVELTRKARQLGRQLEFEFEKLEDHIGYIKFNLFFGELLPKFQVALRNLRDTEALIIDLRGNPGGAGDLAPAVANLLCANAGSLGSLQFRYASQPYSYKGTGDQAYKGKVILLVDEHSGSTAEVFSGGLQENKRVTVIGTPTAGAVLPSLAQLLPTGGVLIHVISNFQTPKGVVLEGRGVMPDITAALSRKALLAGRDPVRERAIQFIKMSR